ncbi:hypothetical protein SAMN04487909_1365 [Aneurinibacillus migulanus]|uniref:Uncharacterized protein n=1 Tax=Aneurinibacillus migulanus TaxID=47500 RepID=A0A1G8YI15_ANEMI|nr:hypothetical protein AMI01nite_48140 [Aneurinibacillus migulanus]SDK02386.1 hypothetical protein SAMN04487909_1365 [Aneurinibacillus migulanus]
MKFNLNSFSSKVKNLLEKQDCLVMRKTYAKTIFGMKKPIFPTLRKNRFLKVEFV